MKHGANIYKYAKKLSCSIDEIIDFSSNITLYQPQTEWSISSKEIARYPQSNASKLKESVAKHYALQKNQIALFNGGATHAIWELFSLIKEKNLFLYAPLYGEYKKAGLQKKKNIYYINRITDTQTQVLENSIVVYVNPSTPEGSHTDLKELMQQWMDLACHIVIDESFLEFEALPSVRKQINNYKKLYIVHSFTKFYASGGVRIGAIFTHKKNVKKFPNPLWSLSALDASFLHFRLNQNDFAQKNREINKIQKLELKNILEKSQLFSEIVPSQTNFILTFSKEGEKIAKHLLTHKILVRTCGSFEYLSNDWLRFSVKSKNDQNALALALEEYLHLYHPKKDNNVTL